MYQHNPWWDKALGTCVTIIIIVAFHSTLAAHEQQHFKSPFKNSFVKNSCKVNLQKAQDIVYFQPTETQKRVCADGYVVNVSNPSQLLLLDESLPIRKLTINAGAETDNDIDIETFYRKPFDRLSELYMSNVNVYGTIESDKSNLKLKALSIHRHSGDRDLNTLIHQFPVEKLEILDLSANRMPNQLNRFYFVNMTTLHQILLANCQIQQFPFDTFHFVRNTIRLIDLTGNYLVKLASGFTSLFPIQTLNQLNIRLDGNPWICDCTAARRSERLQCLENCQPSIVRRSLNDINGKTDAEDVVELQCEDLSDSSKTELVLLKRQTHNITIEPKGNMLAITVTGPPNAYLIWYNDSFVFNMDNDQSISDFMHCNDRPKFEMAVAENSTYTFCVLTSTESDAISPFNCVAYYVNPKSSINIDPELIWITNGQKGMVYAIVVSSILALMILGILLGIFLIRKYPHLLKEHQSPYLLDNSNQFSKRSSCTSSSVFSVDDNNDYIPTYVTPNNFDFVKPPKDKEIVALDASRLDFDNKQMTENQYESARWDNMQKLPIPPAAPDATAMAEQNNFSGNNNKEMDKRINLPISFDSPNKDDDKNSAYAEFQFDEDKND